ncbi:glyoxalase [Neobacillus piezotolerans]|uniref:Glyoxalase n=1 Tax=Neobacillus piezotolerans TaxID=2259171 RepID=A0A3D8GK97_9BACI|nr:VOC family protein [Neobacillus piezotolerans]RDU34875.1 glyoxalase [Neobacillus piezotolerans]
MKFHRPPNTFIGNVHIKVQDLGRSLEFYKRIIGFDVLEQSGMKAVLGSGKKPILTLEQPENAVPKQPRTAGLYHFALLLPSRFELGKFLRHILELGYPIGAADHLVSEAIYLDDPDGNGIEIYTDRPSSVWKWAGNEVEMATNQIDAQGILAEAGQSKWEGMPAETIMGHIHLHVSDLTETRKFYGEGLGFDLVSRYPQALFMSTGGYHHHLGLNTWNGVGAPPAAANSAGLKQFSIMFPGEEKRNKAVGKLENLGFPVSENWTVKDPSGNEIHLGVHE